MSQSQISNEPRYWWLMPTTCVASHDKGNFVLGVSNKGYFGNSTSPVFYKCIGGLNHYTGSEYPRNSDNNYLRRGSIWVGGVLAGDTLVTEGFKGSHFELFIDDTPPLSEMNPEDDPAGEVKELSNIYGSKYFDKGAISNQDLIAIYTDTIIASDLFLEVMQPGYPYRDYLDFRLHKPLYIEISQKSYSWAHKYSEDFVIFDMNVKNIGEKTIRDLSIGLNIYPAAGYDNDNRPPGLYDLVGFLKSYAGEHNCRIADTLNMIWSADNDGDPYNGIFTDQLVNDTAGNVYKSATAALGTLFISTPENASIYFNWWTMPPNDFGPIAKGNYRNFQTGGIGTPEGDRNKYFLMRNGEVDYDPAYAKKISQYDLHWLYPDQQWAETQSLGNNTFNALLSFEAGFLSSGSSIPFSFAVVMGENFHTNPNNLANLPDNPDAYYANLDFSDLAKNAMTAKWIYDNPGIDTDGDGYRGEFRICVLDSILDIDSNWIPTYAETTYYKGDGVPDWKAALPPPVPKIWVTPMFRGIHIRFNGSESENSKDIFTQMNDFEGFKVYLARDDRESSFSLIGTYDIENYDKYVWNYQKQPDPGWDLLEFPMQLRDIRCNYAFNCNDSSFDPLRFRPSQPYVHPNHPESLFYWENHNWNTSEFGVSSNIKKIYPNSRDPRKIPTDSLTPDDYTTDGYLKFFDYEFTIENLLPTVQYYVSVTAFDFGWPASNLEPLETSITDNAQPVFASVIDSVIADDYQKVVAYPNPYRGDEGYRPRGFEGLGQDDRSNERVRRIHFANLPPKCKIMIYSLDGDLVREIHHDKSPNDPTAAHEEWGLISKNGLAVVSGLYYWVVESDDGTVQMGKLAIIL